MNRPACSRGCGAIRHHDVDGHHVAHIRRGWTADPHAIAKTARRSGLVIVTCRGAIQAALTAGTFVAWADTGRVFDDGVQRRASNAEADAFYRGRIDARPVSGAVALTTRSA